MLSVKQMRALERTAAKKGIFSIDLMENAGREIAAIIKEKYDLADKHIIIFCGAGNNGGDGFVAARHFTENPVIILFFGEAEKLTEEAKENYDKIKESIAIVQIKSKQDLEQFKIQDSLDLVLIDAMLGTGTSGKVKEPIVSGIDYFNSLQGIKVAVDIPSGINADTAEGGKAVAVDLVIALHDMKMGAKEFKDKTIIVDIGIP